jgi:murein DD-endopeptidase MepM/ murein hydrolase activator NlpD
MRSPKLAAGLLLLTAVAGCAGSPPATNHFVAARPTPVVGDSATAPANAGASAGVSTAGSTATTPSVPASAPASSKAAAVTYAFPVTGRSNYSREHHDYPASDILAACGSKVVAATTGTVLAVTLVDRWKRAVNAGATRGGLSVSILGDDGVRYYGSHMSAIDAGIRPGAHVTTGERLGKVGDTGDASACHLHFGISPPCARTTDWWNQRGTIWPWRYLDSWRKGGEKSAVTEIKTWQQKNGCPKKPQTDP